MTFFCFGVHDNELGDKINWLEIDLTLFGLGGGGQIGLSPGFSSITQKPFNQSSPKFVTLIVHIQALSKVRV